MFASRFGVQTMAVLLLATGLTGCGSSSSPPDEERTTIRVEGSDTMVRLAQAWSEDYNKAHPNVSIQVSGGGTGVGIASLIEGVADMVDASRRMKEEERELAKENTGLAPVEFVVAQDALALYVHHDNPLDTISIEELAEIYGEDGAITEWRQLGVNHRTCPSDEIVRINRLSNSGTYRYFRETLLGNERDFKLGALEVNGSKEVIAMVCSTPCSIGYSGIGYATDEVKMLRVSRKKGDEGVQPSQETIESGEYPFSRPLFIYTLGQPTGAIKDYMDWIMSEPGRRIASDLD